VKLNGLSLTIIKISTFLFNAVHNIQKYGLMDIDGAILKVAVKLIEKANATF